MHLDVHVQLQQWRVQQEEVAKLEAAIAARQQEEEEERLKREQRREKAARSQQKEKVSEVLATEAVVLEVSLQLGAFFRSS